MQPLTTEQVRTVAAVNRSYEQDAQRHVESYTLHTATAMRLRVIAAGNGHG